MSCARVVRELRQKASALPDVAQDIRYGVCARERITGAPEQTIAITAADIFA